MNAAFSIGSGSGAQHGITVKTGPPTQQRRCHHACHHTHRHPGPHRVISATNKPLDSLIDDGNFRADLFYRLNVIPFQVPPLRERLEDIPVLVEHFNRKFSAEYGKPLKEFTAEAIESLQANDWYGNVRELKNTVERIVIMSGKTKVAADDLPELETANETLAISFRFPTFKDATDAYQREFIQHKLAEFNGNVAKAAEDMGVDRRPFVPQDAESGD